MGTRIHLDAAEHFALALMFGVFEYGGAECRLVGELAGMAVEIAALPFAHWSRNAPGCDEIMPAIAAGRHRKSRLADKCNEKAVSAAAESDFGKFRYGLVLTCGR